MLYLKSTLHDLFDINVVSGHRAVAIRTREDELFGLPVVEDFPHQPVLPPRPCEALLRSLQTRHVRLGPAYNLRKP